jgi:enoyl-CoA hydratase/carnithine racemase
MDGKLKIITFNKPEKKNALSTEMYQSFVQVVN